MVTKENARQIFNLYSQIESTEKVICILKECQEIVVKENTPLITENWRSGESITLEIPQSMLNKTNNYTGVKIYQVSARDAVIVLESHLKRLKEALEQEQNKIMQDSLMKLIEKPTTRE